MAGIVLYALPASQAGAFLDQYVPNLKQFGVTVDPKLAAQLAKDTQAGDTVAAVNDAIQMSVGQANFSAEKVSGLGSAALWSWNTVLKLQEGFLVAAQPGALVAIVVVGNGTMKEDTLKPAVQSLVSGILAALPPDFALPIVEPTPTSNGPVVDTCSLATPSDIEPVLGSPANEGVDKGGSCTFTDAATQKLSVRLFVYPSGPAAIGALEAVSPLILLGNAQSLAKVTTDIAAGDLVAAVRDMAGTPINGKTQTLQPVAGLGASAFFFAQSPGLDRLVYMVAARTNYIIGFQGQLALGDNTATIQAGTTLLNKIMDGLPESFTVKGVP
jgi:hypothetical protein